MSQDRVEELLTLRPGVYTGARDGVRYLMTNRGGQAAGRDTDQLRALLSRLADGPATVAQAGEAAGAPVDALLSRWRAAGWLSITVRCDGIDLYTLQPYRTPAPAPASPPRRWELSRFAVVRNDTGPVVESAHAWCDVRVHDRVVLAELFGHPRETHLARSAASRLMRDLCWAGIAVPAGVETQRLATRQWYPHELWFHQRTRINERITLEEGFAGTYWLTDEFDPPPPPPPSNGSTVALHRPDLARLRTTDPPFTAVAEDRATVRVFNDERPVSAEQVGELLYRSARRSGSPMAHGTPQERRPYPSGGGMHDLVLYPVVRHVDGLEPGMYRYDPERHVLARVCVPNGATHRLLDGAGGAAVLPRAPGQSSRPQLLLVIAARFERTLWKYQQIGYAMMLKNVGVLYHQLYLVATAMGLAPCALATGDAAAFAEATGHDPMTESSVGEMIFGSVPSPDSGDHRD